ncbi:hypothetical protein DXA36_19000 [Eisenbergiella sp. OF01-20]|nr:hypothetical protein DXA36_19000 [Eisenbergiella sp. OF01-20]
MQRFFLLYRTLLYKSNLLQGRYRFLPVGTVPGENLGQAHLQHRIFYVHIHILKGKKEEKQNER